MEAKVLTHCAGALYYLLRHPGFKGGLPEEHGWGDAVQQQPDSGYSAAEIWYSSKSGATFKF